MSQHYRYRLVLEVDVVGDGIHSDGDGAKATADRLVELVKTDRNVVDVGGWPQLSYRGRYHPSSVTRRPDPARAAAQDDPRGEADR